MLGLLSCLQRWETFKEWLSNLTYSLELWRAPIKKIEGNFGSGVKSYFILLKMLLLLNIPVFILSFGFLTIPQLLYLPSPSQNNSRPFTGAELLTGQVGSLLRKKGWCGLLHVHRASLDSITDSLGNGVSFVSSLPLGPSQSPHLCPFG